MPYLMKTFPAGP